MNLIEVQFTNRHYHLQGDMIKWCEDHIGKNPTGFNWADGNPESWEDRIWCVSSAFGSTTFFFKNPGHATAFSLRWI